MKIKRAILIYALSLFLTACGSNSSEDKPVGTDDPTTSLTEAAQIADPVTGLVQEVPVTNPTDTLSDADNQNPVAKAESVANYLGEDVTLDGSASYDPDSDNLVYNWQLIASPPGSSLFEFTDATSSAYSFTPDIRGEYKIRLQVSDDRGGNASIDIGVVTTLPVNMLNYRPVDSEYSKSLEKIILVSEIPNHLHILDPESMSESTVPLKYVPTSVSVSPDGTKAAVGHDGYVSYVDLINVSLINTFSISTNAADVVLAGNGYIYVFPGESSWGGIHNIQIDTGAETISDDVAIYGGTNAKLHPSGQWIYGAGNDILPSSIEKYSIQEGPARYLYDYPHLGDYPVCGDLWMSEDGQRVYTKCTNAFLTTGNQNTDMTYSGSFSVPGINFAVHSAIAGEIAVLPLADWLGDDLSIESTIHLFNDELLGFTDSIAIPEVIVDNKAFDSFGEFIYYHSNGDAKYLILRVAEESELVNDYAIWKVVP